MQNNVKKEALKDFKRIPGVGNRIAEDLWQLGYRAVTELKDRDPEQLYADLCRLQQCKVDRCMFYVFRCAVYFASHATHDPQLLKWWNWKDSMDESSMES
ncbi:MAG: helix-hairpin-helix domain-containing protein [Verrucomicrobia bacterium]|nr:helix-hairpin-helix domain-containing protein [Verrucomicrobiota bacterium]